MGGLGVDEIKWLKPVRPGDLLTVRAHVLETRASKSRPDRGFVKFSFDVRNAAGELSQELGRSPSLDELADRLGASTEDVLEAMESGKAYRPGSFDEPAPAGLAESPAPVAMLGVEDADLHHVVDRQVIEELLDALPDRERAVVRLRFYGAMTQQEIATQLGISQMQVSRVLSRALGTLSQRVTELDPREQALLLATSA